MAVRWRIAILLAVITTINYVDRSVFGVVAPVVRELFVIGDADYALITSGFLFAYGLGQLLAGPIIDRMGTRQAFGIAALLWSLATILHALGRGVWSFFMLRITLGVTEAANFPAATKAVAVIRSARRRTRRNYYSAHDSLDHADARLALGLRHSGHAGPVVGRALVPLVSPAGIAPSNLRRRARADSL